MVQVCPQQVAVDQLPQSCHLEECWRVWAILRVSVWREHLPISAWVVTAHSAVLPPLRLLLLLLPAKMSPAEADPLKHVPNLLVVMWCEYGRRCVPGLRDCEPAAQLHMTAKLHDLSSQSCGQRSKLVQEDGPMMREVRGVTSAYEECRDC